MSNRTRWILALLLSGLSLSASDLLQLKGGAAISGKVLIEKPDQVILDIGYTVLVVPRAEIVSIANGDALADQHSSLAEQRLPLGEDEERPSVKLTATQSAPKPALFQNADSSRPERSVRELVGLIGEAVVQVRTPSGLGSGFIVNEDGFLIT